MLLRLRRSNESKDPYLIIPDSFLIPSDGRAALAREKQFDERLTYIVIPKTRAFTNESRDLARVENINHFRILGGAALQRCKFRFRDGVRSASPRTSSRRQVKNFPAIKSRRDSRPRLSSRAKLGSFPATPDSFLIPSDGRTALAQ